MQFTLGWPQLIYIALVVIALVGAVARHGKLQPAKEENGYVTVVAMGIQAALLWWGGFFG